MKDTNKNTERSQLNALFSQVKLETLKKALDRYLYLVNIFKCFISRHKSILKANPVTI